MPGKGAGTYNVTVGSGPNTITMGSGIYNVTVGHGTDLFVFTVPQGLLNLSFASNDERCSKIPARSRRRGRRTDGDAGPRKCRIRRNRFQSCA